MTTYRKPVVVAVEQRTVHRIVRGDCIAVERWYVTLRFGPAGKRVVKRLAVSAAVADWLRSKP